MEKGEGTLCTGTVITWDTVLRVGLPTCERAARVGQKDRNPVTAAGPGIQPSKNSPEVCISAGHGWSAGLMLVLDPH